MLELARHWAPCRRHWRSGSRPSEQAYELMVAYAAQGRQNDTDDSSSIRRFLQRANAALDGLGECLRQSVAARPMSTRISSPSSKGMYVPQPAA